LTHRERLADRSLQKHHAQNSAIAADGDVRRCADLLQFKTSVPSEGGEALELWLGQADYHNTKCTIQYDNVKVEQGR
jgi:hypothetical protein